MYLMHGKIICKILTKVVTVVDKFDAETNFWIERDVSALKSSANQVRVILIFGTIELWNLPLG